MADTVLDRVSLGYQALWGPLRELRAVQLFVGVNNEATLNASHLLSALDAAWSEQAPMLLLSVQSPQLLQDLLAQAPATQVSIEVHETQLRDLSMPARIQQAHQRGLKLLWRGEPGQRPSAALAPYFSRSMLGLTAAEALAGLRVSLRKHHGNNENLNRQLVSPILADQIYEGLTSWVLAEHCLDDQAAWGVAGWPSEDLLHAYRQRRIQPAQRALQALIAAIDADASSDLLEQILSDEPMLAYRLLRYTNSAALGLRTEIESLRQGLMVLGLSRIRDWLLEQLPDASSDLNLQPLRAAMVLRARLMEQLLDAGASNELRREVLLCGMLSQIDLLLGEPLHEALARLPLSGRINDAILGRGGPYAPYLDVARALESPDTQATHALCEEHQLSHEDVNQALLRTLSAP